MAEKTFWEKYNPAALFSSAVGKDFAEEKQMQFYPESIGHLDQADAFRHMLWLGEMQRKFGTLPASAVGAFNELINSPDHPLDTRMDKHNNALALKKMQGAKSQEDILRIAQELMKKAAPVNRMDEYQRVEADNPFYIGDFAINNPKLFESTIK